jgi:hypothetical protein
MKERQELNLKDEIKIAELYKEIVNTSWFQFASRYKLMKKIKEICPDFDERYE